jgi:SAM-dependent methyltransferase
VQRPPDFAGFAEIDRSGAPDDYAAYLDGVREVAAVAEWKQRSFALLRPRAGAELLDVGCGTGEDAIALAALVAPGGRVVGIDASAAMIDEARRRAAGAAPAPDLRVGDAQRLDLADASFDGARAERTLQHLERPGDAVAEMARVTRPGGWVVAAEPDWGTLVVDAPDSQAGREVAGAAAARLRSGGVGRTLRRLFLDAGLAEVELVARTLLVTDRARSEMLFDLSGAAARAVGEGRLDEGRASAWLAGVDRVAADGRLLVAMTAFMACGRRAAT